MIIEFPKRETPPPVAPESLRTTPAPVIPIRKLEHERGRMSDRALAHFFASTSVMFAKHNVAGAPDRFVLCLMGDESESVQVVFGGVVTWDEYRDMTAAIEATATARQYPVSHATDTPAVVIARRRAYRAERDAKQAAYLAEHPYACDACHDRFKTEAGRRGHITAMQRRTWDHQHRGLAP